MPFHFPSWELTKIFLGQLPWKTLAIACTATVVVLLLIRGCSDHAKLPALREAVTVAQKEAAVINNVRIEDDKAVARYVKAKDTIDTKERIASAKLDATLIEHKEWAAEPIPADVLASLRN